MEKRIEVIAAKPHRTGYANGGKVEKGGKYTVPADRVACLVRMKLIDKPKDWSAPTNEPAGK